MYFVIVDTWNMMSVVSICAASYRTLVMSGLFQIFQSSLGFKLCYFKLCFKVSHFNVVLVFVLHSCNI